MGPVDESKEFLVFKTSGHIPNLPFLIVNFGTLSVSALIDSGASRNLISGRVFRCLSPDLIKEEKKINLHVGLARQDQSMHITAEVKIKFKIDNFSWVHSFLVANELQLDVILGVEFMLKTGLLLNLSEKRLFFKFKPEYDVPIVSYAPMYKQLKTGLEELALQVTPSENAGPNLSHLSPEHRAKVLEILNRYPDVLTKKLGRFKSFEYQIQLTDKTPVRSAPYALAPPMMAVCRDLIQKMQDDEVIEESTSNYSSPCFAVPKPGGKHRLVVDFRKLNQKVLFESIPIPDLKTAFSWFRNARYFIVMDLNQAYFQIGVAKESRPYTAFCTPWNLFQFKRVPFGLSVGGCVLSRLVDKILHDLKFKSLVHYLDDLVIYASTLEELFVYLEMVLKRLREAGITINPEKLQIAVMEILYLGHLISYQSVRIDPSRTQAIREFPRPQSVKAIARFIGMVGFHAKFIPNFSEWAAPLNALRKKNVKFEWGLEQDRAFEHLKEAISSPPILRIPDFDNEFILQTDASAKAVGGVLLQVEDGVRMPIAYFSHRLTEPEEKLSTYELECLGAILSMEHFRPFLEYKEFLLETDNMALSWLLSHPRQQGRIGRWVLRIASFRYRAQHIRGTQNITADCLSRMFEEPVLPKDPTPCEIVSSEITSCNMVSPEITNFPLAFIDLEKHQGEDPQISAIRDKLARSETVPGYSLFKKVVCFSFNGNSNKIVLPMSLVPMVFAFYHQTMVGGHLGQFKTYCKIKEIFYYKGMRADLKMRVAQCEICSMSKPAQKQEFGHLSSDVASRPLEKVFVDFVGPLPRTQRGNRFVLVVVDAFSKFTWLIPTRSATANVVVCELRRLFQNFSLPQIVASDNGKHFVGRVVKQFLFRLGIRHITTTPYYPNPNHAERVNRNLRSALIAFNAKSQTTWDLSLEWIQQSLNYAVHEGHKATPHSLMFTYPPTTPLSLQWKLKDLLPDKAPATQVVDLWKRAHRNLIASQNRSRRLYNMKHRQHPFRVGQLVYVKTHPKSDKFNKKMAKLMPRFEGPYQIQRFLTPVSLLLACPSSGRVIRRAHVSQLKPGFNRKP